MSKLVNVRFLILIVFLGTTFAIRRLASVLEVYPWYKTANQKLSGIGLTLDELVQYGIIIALLLIFWPRKQKIDEENA